MIAGRNYDLIDRYRITAELSQPLHIGSSDDGRQQILVHPSDGLPFVQASGIAGVFRQTYEMLQPGESSDDLFGTGGEDCSGGDDRKIVFTDGRFDGNVVVEMRPSVRIDPYSGTASQTGIKGTTRKAGHKFDTEYIAAGAVFVFCFYVFGTSEKIDTDKESILSILSAIKQGDVRFGGKKSSGSGAMKITSVLYRRYDMRKADDRREWSHESEDSGQNSQDIFPTLANVETGLTAYTITVKGKTEGPLLVKSIAVDEVGKDVPDAVNIRNAGGDYIVPGTSLKGALRNRMQYICDYFKAAHIPVDEGLMEHAFGVEGKSRDTGKAGIMMFEDIFIGQKLSDEQIPLIHRIHIDKFTGGVMNKALFSEKPVSGEFEFTIRIQKRFGQKNADQTCGLLILALRDLSLGMFNLGSGYATGKGFLNIHSVAVVSHADQRSAWFKRGEVRDEGHLISDCLKSLRRKEA